ncbi:TRAP transporter small permease [Salinarimonas ramus]|uniref:TRAP transporter small permease protein n=1 Tax=Salinarimonas ramus TaxID=690164 RepID=A0A917QAV6_9HYPH|nr:TRAP transporter small permease [Salinarimonas ramus]GGK39620.1 transporter [Salinarimonas ramus]
MSHLLARLELVVGSILLGIIVVLVFVAAVMRFFDRPLIWSVDLAQLLFIWLCFVGASRAMRERAHLGVDLLVRRVSPRARLVIEIALAVLFVAFMAVIAVEGTKLTLLNRERLFGDSGLSYAYVTIAVPVGCLFLTLAILANAVEAWRERARGELLVFSRIDAEPLARQEP